MSDRATLDLLTRRKPPVASGGSGDVGTCRRHGLRRMHSITARLAALLSIAILAASCTTQEDNTYDPGEANTRILSMFALRDLECSTTHQLNGVIVNRANRNSVDTCVGALFLLDCTAWQASDPAPAVCKAIGVSFR